LLSYSAPQVNVDTDASTWAKGPSSPVAVVVGSDGTMYVAGGNQNAVVEFDKGATRRICSSATLATPARTIDFFQPVQRSRQAQLTWMVPHPMADEVVQHIPFSLSRSALSETAQYVFPAAAVGIGSPDLVLNRVAARFVGLDVDGISGFLQTS
jgi:hypothetical protein